ncbi:hypothetical protein D3C75_961030 [compost metagenome]
MVSSSDALPGFWTLSKTRDCLVLLRMRLNASAISVPLHAFFTSRHTGSNAGAVPIVTKASPSAARLKGPCGSRH